MNYEDEQDAHQDAVVMRRQSGGQVAEALVQAAEACGLYTMGHPPDPRPEEPQGDAHVWYRGWEVGFSFESEYWCGEGWIAYKGGCDLDAREVRSGTYAVCLDAIDEEEDEA